MYEVVVDEALVSRLEKIGKRNRSLVALFTQAINSLRELEDPSSKGKPLKGKLAGFWRYRFGEYRLICDIQDDVMIVVAFEFDHRSRVYRLGSLRRYGRTK